MGSFFLSTLAAALAFLFLAWLVSLVRRDASVVDAFWGPGFVVIAVVACLGNTGFETRRWLVVGLVALWGLRLGGYLLWRNLRSDQEDYRYRAMRRRHGDAFPWVSLVTVFGLQALLLWFIALPIQVAIAVPGPAHLTLFDGLGIALFSLGFAFEAVADAQLVRFKANPANEGRVLDSGLWRYTRHPNYFGDFLVWWGLFTIALATPYGWMTMLSPILLTFLLMKVSGVPLVEKKLGETREGYREYAKRTNAFFPGLPGE